MSDASRLQQRLGHRFDDPALLRQALTHRSFGSPHNERLEFLGDGVLGCVVAEVLISRFPQASEGELSRLRASLVRHETLASAASALGLAADLRLSQGALEDGRTPQPSILADALEAVIGAVFLDGGYDAARGAVVAVLGAALDASGEGAGDKDPKTRLQEVLQARRHGLPRYEVMATHGAAHQQTFDVECRIEELGLSGRGSGSSRRAAEQQAAASLLRQLGE
ncbi:MAG: ribonuclease III [Burkholderiales bacterium]